MCLIRQDVVLLSAAGYVSSSIETRTPRRLHLEIQRCPLVFPHFLLPPFAYNIKYGKQPKNISP